MTLMVGTDRIKLDTIFAALAVLLSVLAVVTGNPTPPHMRPSCIQIRLACSVDGSWEDRALFHNHRGHSHRRPILDAPRAGPRAARLQQLTDRPQFCHRRLWLCEGQRAHRSVAAARQREQRIACRCLRLCHDAQRARQVGEVRCDRPIRMARGERGRPSACRASAMSRASPIRRSASR